MDTQIPTTRRHARLIGAKRYNTGKPCARGHYADRFTSNGDCDGCIHARLQQWRLENPEKILGHKAEYRKNNREKIREQDRAWRTANPEKSRKSAREWQRNNPERARARQRAWSKANPKKVAAWKRLRYAKDSSKMREKSRQWKARNLDKVRAIQVRREAAKICATPQWADHNRIAEFYFAADFLSMITGEWYHVDHMVPLRSKSVCGLHNHFNLQVLTAKENMLKGNRIWPDMPEVD